MSWDVTTNITQMDGVNVSVINVSVESFLLYPDESCTSWKNYMAETDALNKNVVQYRGEAVLIQHHL